METEANIRELYEKTHDDIVKCLIREDFSGDEKETIVKELREVEYIRRKWDSSNSKFWYEYGEIIGISEGITLGVICYASGFMFGKILMKIISKK